MRTKDITVCGIFTAITIVFAQNIIPIGAIPISFAMIAIYLCGGLLSPKHAAISQLIYLLIGAIGVPVFAGFTGGIQKFVGPTGGYLIVYPIMALAISILMSFYDKKFKGKPIDNYIFKLLWIFIALIIAVCICYLGGSIWFSIVSRVSFSKAITITVLPFIIADIIKIVISGLFIVALRDRIKKLYS